MMSYVLSYRYDKRGRGDLVLYKDGRVYKYWEARTGSVDGNGKLVNALPPDIYKILEPSVRTSEQGMRVDGGEWFKIRLYRQGQWTHYLIHFDEGNNGSKGCIVTQSPAPELYQLLDAIYKEQREIVVEVKAEGAPE